MLKIKLGNIYGYCMHYCFRVIGLDCPLCTLSLVSSLKKIKEFTSVSSPLLSTKVIIEADIDEQEVLNILKKVEFAVHGQLEFYPEKSV